MRALVGVAAILAFASVAVAAPQDTKPAEAAAAAFIQTIAAKDFEAFKALCTTKLQAEHAKNAKNCHITRWWDAAQEAQAKHGAKYVFKRVSHNYPKNVTVEYTRTQDSGEAVVPLGVVLDGDKWLIDSAGAL
ncbi:MAG TPA: hypothetical protein PK668_06010 [Myxococcota bacterium]|nr:hypothetical protein [Myxococcota bacterium]HRY92604.1 hypothetical protein [Myxococcota bacterium]HSA23697.1 hypothetical protein [Myxococcota bacterium]